MGKEVRLSSSEMFWEMFCMRLRGMCSPLLDEGEISKLKIVYAQLGCSSVGISFHVYFLEAHHSIVRKRINMSYA